jgi:hypothetical protein
MLGNDAKLRSRRSGGIRQCPDVAHFSEYRGQRDSPHRCDELVYWLVSGFR